MLTWNMNSSRLLIARSLSHSRTIFLPLEQRHSLCFRPQSTQSFKANRTIHTPSTTTSNTHTQPQSVHTGITNKSRRPLQKLPNYMLWRSLLVATISSHKPLLVPALAALRLLTGSRRLPFVSVENPAIHYILKKTFYNQFCAGENAAETKQCVRSLKELGFRGVMLTYARETVFDHRTRNVDNMSGSHHKSVSSSTGIERDDISIRAWRDGTLETLALIGSDDFLVMKLTGGGPNVTEAFVAGLQAPQQMMEALRHICRESKRRGNRVIIDAESHHFQKGISDTALQLMREFNTEGFAVVYNTYQAYLKKTPQHLAEHLLAAEKGGFALGLKLVRGAYMLSDDRSLIHDTKQDTDDAFDRIADGALMQQFSAFGESDDNVQHQFPSLDLFIASHNRDSVLRAYRLHREQTLAGQPTVPTSFGQLHGMSDEVSFSLLTEGETEETLERSKGPAVYKCTTWGSMRECIAYLLRRAIENRDSVLRTKTEYEALKAEAWIRLFSRNY